MKIEYDKEVDALYIRIQEKDVARTEEVSDGVNLDFDGDGTVDWSGSFERLQTLLLIRYFQSLNREPDTE